MKDVIIIGAGVVGSNIAYELSKFNLDVMVLEKENDVSMGTSKANSGIIHAGYDPKPNTLMAQLNIKGSKMMPELCKKLNVAYKQIGSLVLGFDDADRETINQLYKRGLENGVLELSIIEKDDILKIEPNVQDNVQCALYAKTAGVISPWELTIALMETAIKNGVSLKLCQQVLDISETKDGFLVKTNKCEYKTKYIINASGINADKIHNMVLPEEFKTVYSRGEYYLLDKSNLVNSVVFQCPNKDGKGVLVSQTVHGNIIVGPSAEDIVDESTKTTNKSLEFIREKAEKSVKNINYRENIRNFAGIRATTDIDDFIIKKYHNNFIDVAGIKSPGLSAAPAIALMVSDMIDKTPKESFVDTREKIKVSTMSVEEKNEIIKKDSRFGRIICRCEKITEGEIIAALNTNIDAYSLDAVKRRVSSGMGRCQGGFCAPKIIEIIAREKNISVYDVLQDKEGTNVLIRN